MQRHCCHPSWIVTPTGLESTWTSTTRLQPAARLHCAHTPPPRPQIQQLVQCCCGKIGEDDLCLQGMPHTGLPIHPWLGHTLPPVTAAGRQYGKLLLAPRTHTVLTVSHCLRVLLWVGLVLGHCSGCDLAPCCLLRLLLLLQL
jgi:hypothetical protein